MTQPATDLPDTPAIDRLTELGAALAKPSPEYADSAPDLLTAIVPPGHSLIALDLSDYDELRTAPRRVKGQAIVTDTASFLGYFGKHKTTNSEVFGDVRRGTITAVLNGPGADEPAWGDHRVVLKLEESAAWQVWQKLNNRALSQNEFAEHIEARTPDFVDPDAASMLEIAQSISATTGVKFESSQRLADGQRRLQYLEQIEARAGTRGQLDVPSQFAIKLQPWRGVALAVELTARLRFRIQPGGLTLAYVLDQVEDRQDEAWDALLEELRGEIPVPILAGQAPDYAG